MRSILTEEADSAVVGPVLLAASETAAAAIRNTTVPAEQEETVIAIDDPEAAAGVNTQPVAVPVLEKSAAVKPEMASEKVKL